MITMKAIYSGIIFDVTPKQKEALDRLFGYHPDARSPETVAEYISRTNCKTRVRTSKRGVDLITVYYEDGTVKEYELDHVDTTTAYHSDMWIGLRCLEVQ